MLFSFVKFNFKQLLYQSSIQGSILIQCHCNLLQVNRVCVHDSALRGRHERAGCVILMCTCSQILRRRLFASCHDNFTSLLQLVNKLKQTYQFHYVPISRYVKSAFSWLVICMKQLVPSLWITTFDNQLAASDLLTTCNRLVVNKLSPWYLPVYACIVQICAFLPVCWNRPGSMIDDSTFYPVPTSIHIHPPFLRKV